jgi:hypothetical protein
MGVIVCVGATLYSIYFYPIFVNCVIFLIYLFFRYKVFNLLIYLFV